MMLPSTSISIFAWGGLTNQASLSAIALAGECGHAQGVWECIPHLPKEKQPATPPPQWDVAIGFAPMDAAIHRARANVVKAFLGTDLAVLVMLDHDIKYKTQGIQQLASLCQLTRGIVAAPVSKKSNGNGIASLLKRQTIDRANMELVPAHYVGGAFTAYHRDVLSAISQQFQTVSPGYKPICNPMVVDHPIMAGQRLDLTEDWVLSYHASKLGYNSYIASAIESGHEAGKDMYTVETSISETDRAIASGRPKISVIHASRGEPEKCKTAISRMLGQASGEYGIEYILAIDADDESMRTFEYPGIHVVSGSSRGPVDAFNRAAYASTGQILCQMHDDLEYPSHWDKIIVGRVGVENLHRPILLKVSDGVGANTHQAYLHTVLVGTAALFRSYGYFYYPEYISVYADNDISLQAAANDHVVQATDIVVLHRWAGQQSSEAKRRQYHKKNWEDGARLLDRRRHEGFPAHPKLWGKVR